MTLSRSTRRLLRLLVITAVSLGAFAYPNGASADTLYAATGSGGNAAKLYTLNSSTGAATFVADIKIGATQVTHLTGLSVDPTDGTMYGFINGGICCPNPDFDSGTLITIDKTTGAATVMGTMGGSSLRASDMAFDRFGTLYAWSGGCGNDADCDLNASDLFTLDTTTGAATKVGESATQGFTTGLASDSKGRMYMKDFEALFRINQFTGHIFSPVDLSTNGQRDNMLTFGPGDVLYTGDRGFSSAGLQLQTIDTATGQRTDIGVPNGIQNMSSIEWDLTTPTAPDEADLRLNLSVDIPAPTAETDVEFTVTLINDGPDSATGVVVNDLLPSGFTYVSDDPDVGTYDETTGVWNVGTLASAGILELDIVATVHSTGLHTNTAEVVQTNTYDTDSVPGSSEGDTFDSSRSAPAGATTLYAANGIGSVFCHSNGGQYEDGSASSLYELDPSNGDVRKVAEIRIGSTQVNHVSGLAVHPSTGVLYGFINRQDQVDCDVDPQGPGTLITIDKITGAATVVGSMGAAAIVAPDISFDPFGTLYAWNRVDEDLYTLDTTTGTATKVGECGGCTPGPRVGLAVDSVGRMFLKNQFELFRLNPVTGTVVSSVGLSDQAPRDMLAFGPNDVLYTGSRESENFLYPQTFGLWTIDADGTTTLLGTNDSVLQMSALAWDLGPITPPDEADLSLTKDVDDSTPDDWFQHVTFTITVDNDGPDDATDVEVTDLLPSGLSYVSDDSGGDYNPGTGIWDVGTITNGNSAVLEIVASVQTSGSYTNTAEVTDAGTFDPDSVPGGGSGEETFDSETLTPTPTPGVDLAADVIVSGQSRATNTRKGFSVKLTNVGTQPVAVTGGNLIAEINGNGGAVTCKGFSTTLKVGRSFKAQCTANIAALGLTPGDALTYTGTADLPGDGFTSNDTDEENRTAS